MSRFHRTVALLPQVRRTSVFADACATLRPADPSQLFAGPCVIAPIFLASSPDNHPSQSSSHRSMHLAFPAHRSQAISHSTTSTACHSGIDVQSSSACGSAAQAEARPAAVGSDADVSDGSSVLREEGEGRGPRKEFFAAVGADISAGVCSYTLMIQRGLLCQYHERILKLPVLRAHLCIVLTSDLVHRQLCWFAAPESFQVIIEIHSSLLKLPYTHAYRPSRFQI